LRSISKQQNLFLFVILSFLGFILVFLLLIFPVDSYSLFFRKQLIGFIFNSLCLLGAIAVFFPNTCSNLGTRTLFARNNTRNLSSDRYSKILGLKIIHGHHNKNSAFSRHEFQINNKTICAGCFGLFLGSLVSIGLIIMYSLIYIDLSFGYLLSTIGIIFSALALFVPIFINGYAILRVILNSWFVIGMSFILIGVDSTSMNVINDLLVIGIFIIWMMNRILLSQFKHKKIYDKKNHKNKILNNSYFATGFLN
jgi:hypothetical protein